MVLFENPEYLSNQKKVIYSGPFFFLYLAVIPAQNGVQ